VFGLGKSPPHAPGPLEEVRSQLGVDRLQPILITLGFPGNEIPVEGVDGLAGTNQPAFFPAEIKKMAGSEDKGIFL